MIRFAFEKRIMVKFCPGPLLEDGRKNIHYGKTLKKEGRERETLGKP